MLALADGLIRRFLPVAFHDHGKVGKRHDRHRAQKDRGEKIHQKRQLPDLRERSQGHVDVEYRITDERDQIQKRRTGDADIGDRDDRHRQKSDRPKEGTQVEPPAPIFPK